MKLNKYCRIADVNDGLVIFDSVTENCVEVDNITGEVIKKLRNTYFTRIEVYSLFRTVDSRVNDLEIENQLVELINEGIIIDE